MKKPPAQRPGKSVQDVGTPADFLHAVLSRFGAISFDLAASDANHVGPHYWTEKDDALSASWIFLSPGLLWLNPPFDNIGAFAEKCSRSAEEAKGFGYEIRIAMLTPASVGTNWFAKHVHQKARVFFLSPRLKFVGHADPYPKDLILSEYGSGVVPGYETWRWKP